MCLVRLHYTTTPLTPIHELREMTSSEMSDYCPTVVSSSEAAEEPYRPVIVDSVDRRWKSRRRSDPVIWYRGKTFYRFHRVIVAALNDKAFFW